MNSGAMTDDEREAAIDQAYLELQTAQTPAQRRRANTKMTELIKQRSAGKIKSMERERGLANDGR